MPVKFEISNSSPMSIVGYTNMIISYCRSMLLAPFKIVDHFIFSRHNNVSRHSAYQDAQEKLYS
jgi:hypothetical protein